MFLFSQPNTDGTNNFGIIKRDSKFTVLVFQKILGFRRNQMADKTERNQNLEKDH